MTLVGKGSMFLSSYVPLFALLAVRASATSRTAMWIFIALAAIGIGGLALVASALLARQKRSVVITEVQPQGEQVAAYVASYLIPLATLGFGSWQDDVVLASFIALIGLIYVQSTMIHLNPLLPLIGFRAYRVRYRTAGAPDSATQAEGVIVTRSAALQVGSSTEIKMFGSAIGVSQ